MDSGFSVFVVSVAGVTVAGTANRRSCVEDGRSLLGTRSKEHVGALNRRVVVGLKVVVG